MSEPKGDVVARPLVKRACGCVREFQHYAQDKFRAQRQAKFQATRCAECVAKLVEAQRAAATLPAKGEALARLPVGTTVSVTRTAAGHWAGILSAGGVTVDVTGETPWGVTLALARRWAAQVPPPSAS